MLNNFNLKKTDISVDVDFGKKEGSIDFDIIFSAMILKMAIVGIRILLGFKKLSENK